MSALSGKVSIISSNANQLLSTDEGVTPDPAQALCRARETLQRTEGHPVLFQNNTQHTCRGLGENKGKRKVTNQTQIAALRNQ